MAFVIGRLTGQPATQAQLDIRRPNSRSLRNRARPACLQYPTPSLQAPAIAFCSMGTLSNVFHAADVTLGKGAEAPKLRDVHLAVSPFAKMPLENDGLWRSRCHLQFPA
jgi:hypothetical protein